MKNELKVLVGDFQRRYEMLDVDQQKKLRIVTARVLAVGTAATLMGALYSHVPPLVRVFALPMLMIGSWYISGRIASGDWPVETFNAPQRTGAFGKLLDRLRHGPTLALLGAFMMVTFLFVGLIWGPR